MLAERSELSVNDGESFDAYVVSMREASGKAGASLEDILRRKRGDETPS